MKKSFVIHLDSLDILEELTDDQVGKLLRKMKSYHNGNIYKSEDKLVDILFINFKNQFDRDLETYNNVCERNREIAVNRWDKKKSTKSTTRKSGTITSPKSTRNTDNDNDSDSDSEKDNSEFDLFWNLYDKKIDKDKCYKKWIKLSDVERAAALNHIPQYKLSQPDKQFRKNPETYINNKSWDNEIITGGLDYTNLNNFHDMMMQDKVPELKQALGLEKYFEIKKLRKESPLYLSF